MECDYERYPGNQKNLQMWFARCPMTKICSILSKPDLMQQEQEAGVELNVIILSSVGSFSFKALYEEKQL